MAAPLVLLSYDVWQKSKALKLLQIIYLNSYNFFHMNTVIGYDG